MSPAGFVITAPKLAVLTERQLYGERAQQMRRRRRAARDPEAIIRDLGELSEGAPVVHEDHGVGRYRGLVKLDVGGTPGEFLALEYARGDKLYVPVAQLHLVSRYTGTAPEFAPPSILDYRPRSTLRTAEHLVKAAKYPAIDYHGHPGQLIMSAQGRDSLGAALDSLNVRGMVSADNRARSQCPDVPRGVRPICAQRRVNPLWWNSSPNDTASAPSV